MTNDSNTAKEIEAHRTSQRLGDEQVKVLLIVNSGAVVALLAFLQAMWPQKENATNQELISIILWAMVLFTLGICVILPVHVLRRDAWSRTVDWLFRTSMACFVFGAGILIFGAMRLPQPV